MHRFSCSRRWRIEPTPEVGWEMLPRAGLSCRGGRTCRATEYGYDSDEEQGRGGTWGEGSKSRVVGISLRKSRGPGILCSNMQWKGVVNLVCKDQRYLSLQQG